MKKNKRPTIVTVVCGAVAFGMLFSLLMLFSRFLNIAPSWYPVYLILNILLGFAAIMGMWTMKKWGLILYFLRALIQQIVLVIAGLWTPFALIFPITMLIALSTVWKDMDA